MRVDHTDINTDCSLAWVDAEGDGEEDGEGGGDVVHDDVSGAPWWSPARGPW